MFNARLLPRKRAGDPFISFINQAYELIRIDTSGATKAHQYVNRFIDAQTFAWQSQNQQRQDNAEGQLILGHKSKGLTLYLFVQSRSHEKAYYCGPLAVVGVEGNAPMNVTFRLEHPLSSGVSIDLLGG